jgi:hypothetical protein
MAEAGEDQALESLMEGSRVDFSENRLDPVDHPIGEKLFR